MQPNETAHRRPETLQLTGSHLSIALRFLQTQAHLLTDEELHLILNHVEAARELLVDILGGTPEPTRAPIQATAPKQSPSPTPTQGQSLAQSPDARPVATRAPIQATAPKQSPGPTPTQGLSLAQSPDDRPVANQSQGPKPKSIPSPERQTVAETFSRREVLSDSIHRQSPKPLAATRIESLERGMSINDRILYAKELFDGNSQLMRQALNDMERLNSLHDALEIISSIYNGPEDNPVLIQFKELLHRRFTPEP